MAPHPSPPTSGWRTLSQAELATLPEARLGGALAAIVYIAAALSIGLLMVIVGVLTIGHVDVVVMMLGIFISGRTLTANLALINLVPQAMMFVWAIVVTVMVISRRPATPRVASILIAVWAVLAIGAHVLGRLAIAKYEFDLVSQASLIPYIGFDVVFAAAFWGYMQDGRRPNIYFRRRVRA